MIDEEKAIEIGSNGASLIQKDQSLADNNSARKSVFTAIATTEDDKGEIRARVAVTVGERKFSGNDYEKVAVDNKAGWRDVVNNLQARVIQRVEEELREVMSDSSGQNEEGQALKNQPKYLRGGDQTIFEEDGVPYKRCSKERGRLKPLDEFDWDDQ